MSKMNPIERVLQIWKLLDQGQKEVLFHVLKSDVAPRKERRKKIAMVYQEGAES